MTPKILQKIPSLVLFSTVLFLVASCKNQETSSHNSKPNVIIIYTDDQGSIDVNCYGATDLHTPNMDLLAETGVRFTQFYAAAAICSPSRAALLTGKTPLAAGLPNNSPSKAGEKGMPTEQITIAEALKENGYATAHIGKWHLGYTEETMPNGQGFDYSFGHMGGCIDNYSHFFYWAGPNRHDLWENNKEVWHDGAYFQDLTSEKALGFIEENKDKPFFMYYAMNLPHYPYQGTAKWREYYKDLDSPRDKFAACVSTIDESIGTLLNKLEELQLRDNTIIIFQSDHGHSTEQRAFYGGGNAGIYRGAKFSYFEGGIRVPAIISWPKTIPQNSSRDQMSVNMDWFPSILDLCSIAYDESDFEGKSLKNTILNNAPSPHDILHWQRKPEFWAVRKGDWKLQMNPTDPSNKGPIQKADSLFLSNIKDYPEEMINMASQFPEIVEDLKKEHQLWLQSLSSNEIKVNLK